VLLVLFITFLLSGRRPRKLLWGHILRSSRNKRKAVRGEAKFFSFSEQAVDGSQDLRQSSLKAEKVKREG
jgi:hypothetical protein